MDRVSAGESGAHEQPLLDRGGRVSGAVELRAELFCGMCTRRMQCSWNNDQAYYRCTYPSEYAHQVRPPPGTTCNGVAADLATRTREAGASVLSGHSWQCLRDQDGFCGELAAAGLPFVMVLNRADGTSGSGDAGGSDLYCPRGPMMGATGTARRMILSTSGVGRSVPGGCMSGDVASLAAEMTPYVSAAVAAYGGAVLAKVQNLLGSWLSRTGPAKILRCFRQP